MRPRGKMLHVFAQIVGRRNGAHFFFPLALRARRRGGIAIQRLLIGGHMPAERRKCRSGTHNRNKQSTPFHKSPETRPYSAPINAFWERCLQEKSGGLLFSRLS